MSNTITRKPTQRDNFNEIRQILVDGGYPDHLIEFIDGRLAQLDKKNNAERKPTAKQVENAGFKQDILDWMESGTVYACADVVKGVPSISAAGLSPNRVTAMLTQLVNDGKVIRETENRKSVYHLA
jgi:hypothetical protein